MGTGKGSPLQLTTIKASTRVHDTEAAQKSNGGESAELATKKGTRKTSTGPSRRQTDLWAIDESRAESHPSEQANSGKEKESKEECGKQQPKFTQKKGSRLRWLTDRYVACIHAIDGAGDMRGNISGGHTFVYGSDPFRTDVDSSN